MIILITMLDMMRSLKMPEYSPTPEEIEQRCLEVQETWDEATRESRRTGLPQKDRPRGWTPPIIAISDIRAIIASADIQVSEDNKIES